MYLNISYKHEDLTNEKNTMKLYYMDGLKKSGNLYLIICSILI